MNYLTIENASKSYGEKVLFENLSLRINQGDKVAIIARNGSGKSTLLRMISGTESLEGIQPRLMIADQIRVGYLPQEPDFTQHDDILSFVISINLPEFAALRAYLSGQETGDARAIERASLLMDDAKAWDIEARTPRTIAQIWFSGYGQTIG